MVIRGHRKNMEKRKVVVMVGLVGWGRGEDLEDKICLPGTKNDLKC